MARITQATVLSLALLLPLGCGAEQGEPTDLTEEPLDGCQMDPVDLDIWHRSIRASSCILITPLGTACGNAQSASRACLEPTSGQGGPCVAGLPCHPVTVWFPRNGMCTTTGQVYADGTAPANAVFGLEFSDSGCP